MKNPWGDPDKVAGQTDIEPLPCAGCDGVVWVLKSFIAQVAVPMNHARKKAGFPLARRGELALCPKCYRAHRAQLLDRAARERAHDRKLWRVWVKAELSGAHDEPEERSRADSELFARLNDVGTHRELVTRIRGRRSGKRRKARGDKAWEAT